MFVWIAAIGSLFVGATALAECESVKGRVVSTVVTTFSDGTPCLSLCTEGRFSGDLRGEFRFIATGQYPFALIDPNSPADMLASTGIIELETNKICEGTLTFADTAAFSIGPDGNVVAIDTIVAGDGSCSAAAGRIRISGIFQGGCVDCRYVGEVCGVGDEDDDDDD